MSAVFLLFLELFRSFNFFLYLRESMYIIRDETVVTSSEQISTAGGKYSGQS